jgi:hypothetical protein
MSRAPSIQFHMRRTTISPASDRASVTLCAPVSSAYCVQIMQLIECREEWTRKCSEIGKRPSEAVLDANRNLEGEQAELGSV